MFSLPVAATDEDSSTSTAFPSGLQVVGPAPCWGWGMQARGVAGCAVSSVMR